MEYLIGVLVLALLGIVVGIAAVAWTVYKSHDDPSTGIVLIVVLGVVALLLAGNIGRVSVLPGDYFLDAVEISVEQPGE